MKSLDTKLFEKLINSDEKLLPTGCLSELLKEIDFSFHSGFESKKTEIKSY